jgi:hypothetical protein
MAYFLVLMLIAVLYTGCPPTDTVRRTNFLQPGMSPTQVKAVMGEPLQTQFVAERVVWQYTLHQSYRGYRPHYLIFEGEPLRLTSWFPEQAAFERQRAVWFQVFPPPQ